MRLAAIDIGTNTAQLLVAERDGTGLRRIHTAERFVRLGEGVDAQRHIKPAAQDRLLDALHDHVQAAREHGADDVSAAGTSALRDSANRDEILTSIHDRLGLSIEILSGPEEATWSFTAACSAFDDLSGTCLVVDIGGGSTELVAGHPSSRAQPAPPNAITDRASLDVGCVRLTERCFSSQPPSADAIDAAEKIIDEALAPRLIETTSDPTLIGTAGTASALALVHAGPDSTWDALHGSGFSLSRSAVHNWRHKLLRLTLDEIHALHPDAMEGRADVFSIGVMLLDRIMDRYNRDTCRVSPHELRHGLVIRTLAKR